MHTLAIDEGGRIRSWGINDNACLGRITSDVPDPENPGKVIDNEVLETVPTVIESLEREEFRAVSVAAGDSVSVAVSDKGEIRAWGSFRVSHHPTDHDHTDARETKAYLVSTVYRVTARFNSHPSRSHRSKRSRS